MNIKKLFATLAGVSLFAQTVVPSAGVLGATYSEELTDAYNWAYSKGVTTMDSIDNANMYGAITRAQMAKMLSVYAKEVLGNTPDTSKACTFSDIDSVKGDLHDFIIESCQLGIMGQGITAFRPYDTISRAEFGTALSRVLWGDKNEGGTPYYAKHLDALKAAGIMTQIDNPENRDEVRGYVMLMLMRSDEGWAGVDCEDPVVALACLDPELDAYKECPAACRDNGEDNADEDGVVKSGDLEVSANAAADRKILINGTSDLDTLTFKSSEEVTLNKVVLERYGYSANTDVDQIWLENEDGTVISNVYDGLDTKGQAKLSIKKDYRTIDGSYNATIVLKAKGAAGKTMWFKVVDVDSTAKNLNVDNYSPYTYDMVDYSGASVTFTVRWTSKDYNWEADKMYEISKFKVKAPSDSSITVKGFTLSKTGVDKNNIDLRRYLDKAEVTVDGKSVDASYEVNKDDQLVVSFKKDVELAAKDNIEFVVSASFGDTFYNEYAKVFQLGILDSADFNATDGKTSSRVTVSTDLKGASWPTYTFKGGKVKINNTRLGNVDGAQAANDVVVAEWTISIPEDIKWELVVQVKDPSSPSTTGAAYAIQAMRVVIAGDEYEFGTPTTSDNWETAEFKVSNVEVVKSGKVQIKVDVRDTDAFSGKKLNFSFTKGFNSNNNFVYVEGKKNIDVAGSISFSDLTIQAAKGSLTNSLTKDVEFRNKEVNRKVVFDGTYTAKKGGIKLNEFTVNENWTVNLHGSSITFYLTVDGDEVADAKWDASAKKATSTFSNVQIDSEKSVNVKLEAEVDASTATWEVGKFYLNLVGEDENGNVAWQAKKTTTKLKIVEVGAVEVSTSTSKKDILRKASNVVLAEFNVKPANGASEVDLEKISFDLAGTKVSGGSFTSDDVTLTIAGVTEDATSSSAFEYAPTTTVKSEWVTVRVELNEEANWEVSLTNLKVNGKDQSSKEFTKAYYPAVVKVSKMEDLNGTTRYTLSVDKDSDIDVRNFKVYNGSSELGGYDGEFADGDRFSIAGTDKVVTLLDKVTYEYSDSSVAATCAAVPAGASFDDHTAAASPTAAADCAYSYPANDKTAYTGPVSPATTWTCAAVPAGASFNDPAAAASPTADTDCAYSYPAAGNTYNAGGYRTVTVEKSKLADYFKIGSNEEDLKIFKL